MLSAGDSPASDILPVLAGLGIAAIARPFDSGALQIVQAANPDLVIVFGDLADPAGGRMVAAVAGYGLTGLLAVDTGRSVTGAVAALELGADAVLSALDDARFIRATIGALFRRLHPPADPVPSAARVGAVTIDTDTCEVRESGELVPLTRTEFRIVAYLAANNGRVRSPGQILSAIHEYNYTDAEAQQAVKVYIRRIRQKFGACAHRSAEVVTVRAFGYRLQAIGQLQPAASAPAVA